MRKSNFLEELDRRGLIQDTTDRTALEKRLVDGPITLYHGIDPSAPSLHIGNFVGVLMLRRFQDAGHKPIALIGGSTGMIGDPGGRSEERNLLDEGTLQQNLKGIQAQLENLLDIDQATLVNNFDWTKDINVLDFLRDVGKHATINQMVGRESVRSRMESTNGISFTEFSYMLLQAFDFWWLHQEKNCELQIGGSDQWGNIAQGVDLIRRRSRASAHGLTWPLITRSDGQKYGKSVDGAVWLDEKMTLPYEFHQYWLRVDDRDLERFLLQLTLLDVDDILEIVQEHNVAPEKRVGQNRLADEITALVHGEIAVKNSKLAAQALFGNEHLTEEMFEALSGIVQETSISSSVTVGDDGLLEALVLSGLVESKGEARRLVKQGGVSINRQKVSSTSIGSEQAIGGKYILLQKGKKQRNILVISD
jgi:tyrosyl-tRNA synthetase